eukprot:Nk52_evm20s2630 gene=Nk52_evmTU20s2630
MIEIVSIDKETGSKTSIPEKIYQDCNILEESLTYVTAKVSVERIGSWNYHVLKYPKALHEIITQGKEADTKLFILHITLTSRTPITGKNELFDCLKTNSGKLRNAFKGTFRKARDLAKDQSQQAQIQKMRRMVPQLTNSLHEIVTNSNNWKTKQMAENILQVPLGNESFCKISSLLYGAIEQFHKCKSTRNEATANQTDDDGQSPLCNMEADAISEHLPSEERNILFEHPSSEMLNF